MPILKGTERCLEKKSHHFYKNPSYRSRFFILSVFSSKTVDIAALVFWVAYRRSSFPYTYYLTWGFLSSCFDFSFCCWNYCQIWKVADPNDKGSVDFHRFCVICRLIAHAQNKAPISPDAIESGKPHSLNNNHGGAITWKSHIWRFA